MHRNRSNARHRRSRRHLWNRNPPCRTSRRCCQRKSLKDHYRPAIKRIQNPWKENCNQSGTRGYLEKRLWIRPSYRHRDYCRFGTEITSRPREIPDYGRIGSGWEHTPGSWSSPHGRALNWKRLRRVHTSRRVRPRGLRVQGGACLRSKDY